MNLFGVEIRFASRNGNFIKVEDCHQAQESLKNHLDKRLISLDQNIGKRITDVDINLNRRIDDIQNLIETIQRFILKE